MLHNPWIILAYRLIRNSNSSPTIWTTISQLREDDHLHWKDPGNPNQNNDNRENSKNLSLCNSVVSTELLCPACLAPECHFSARFRTRQTRGQLVAVSSQQGRDRFALQLLEGHLCVLLQFRPDPARSLCLSKAQVTDGQWHNVAAIR